MALFRKKLSNQLAAEVGHFESMMNVAYVFALLQENSLLEALERKLSYEVIQLFRFLTRRQVRMDIKTGKLQQDQHSHKPESNQGSGEGGWGLGWLIGYGSSGDSPRNGSKSTGNMWNMTDQQQKELYEAVDYDEEAVGDESGDAPPDALKLRVATRLKRGSLALRSTLHAAQSTDIISVVFDHFKADVVQRPNNLEGTLTLSGFRVFDGTTRGSIYPQIVRVKERHSKVLSRATEDFAESNAADISDEDPFLYLKFEHKPLDERADSALTVRLRYMEIIYHKGYVEAVYQFFRPPESQMRSLEALLVRNLT